MNKLLFLTISLAVLLGLMSSAAAQSRVLNLVDRELCLALDPSEDLQSVVVRPAGLGSGVAESLLGSLRNVMLIEEIEYDEYPDCSSFRSVLILDVFFDTERSYYVQLSATDYSRRNYPAPVDLWRRVTYGVTPEGESLEARLVPIAEDLLFQFTAEWRVAHPD
ncbi:MAG: hypothetical protein AAF267_16015 [Deinococcota bacterium]